MSDEHKDPNVRVVDRRWWAREQQGDPADPANGASSTKPTYVEDLEQRLADAAKQLQAYMADQKRAFDEFEQVKARMRRDVAREVERGKRQVLAELLDVVDNLDRAIAAAEEAAGASNEAAEKLAHGVRLVRDQFLAKLGSFGVSRVPSLGEKFDAARHEAITTAPVASPEQDGVVISVVKEGYAIGEELLRPASVVVGVYGQQ
jgi:molecular chaperone GrpE